MTYNIVDQREVQRWGKGCGRFPTSCVIRELLKAAGLLQPLKTITVWDMTYGEGRFWVLIPQAKIIAWDIRNLTWYRQPFQFLNKPCWTWRFISGLLHPDLVVVDPPFLRIKRGDEKRKHYRIESSPEAIIKYCGVAAALHHNAMLLIHYDKKIIPEKFRVVTELFFKPKIWRARNYVSWFAILKPF